MGQQINKCVGSPVQRRFDVVDPVLAVVSIGRLMASSIQIA